MKVRRITYKAPRVYIVSALWIGDSWQEYALSPGEAMPAGPFLRKGLFASGFISQMRNLRTLRTFRNFSNLY